MRETPTGQAGQDDQERCLASSVQAMASHLWASDGRKIPFMRAVLSVRNACGEDLVDLSVHVRLGQEGGTVQDVTNALSGPSALIPPNGTVSWDVYDLLLPAHQGTASKVHMFGYRAVLNWRFDLAVWAEFRRASDSSSVRTPESRWVLRWSVPDPTTGAVELAITEGKD
jgi:hypothetical protein